MYSVGTILYKGGNSYRITEVIEVAPGFKKYRLYGDLRYYTSFELEYAGYRRC